MLCLLALPRAAPPLLCSVVPPTATLRSVPRLYAATFFRRDGCILRHLYFRACGLLSLDNPVPSSLLGPASGTWSAPMLPFVCLPLTMSLASGTGPVVRRSPCTVGVVCPPLELMDIRRRNLEADSSCSPPRCCWFCRGVDYPTV